MKIEQKDLLRKLEFIAPAIKGNIKGADVICFEDNMICSYNQYMAAQVPLEGLTFACCVKINELLKIVRKNKKSTTATLIYDEDKKQLKIRYESTTYKLATYKTDVYTDVISTIPDEFKHSGVITPDVLEKFSNAFLPQSKNSVYSGLYFDKTHILTTDVKSIASVEYTNLIGDGFWFTRESLLMFTSIAKDNGFEEMRVRLDNGWLLVNLPSNERIAIRSLNLDPNPFNKIDDIYTKFVDLGEPIVTLTVEQTQFINRLNINKDSMFSIKVKGQKLIVRSQSLIYEAVESVKAEIEWGSDEEFITGFADINTVKHCLDVTDTFSIISIDDKLALYFYNEKGFNALVTFTEPSTK